MAQSELAMPRRVATGVDPKRLAMIVAVLARHAGIPLGQADVFVNVAGGVRIDEPGADLAIALAIASAARRVPVKEGRAAFGEIGLTGRLRTAAQAERRLEECTKLGLTAVVAPAGTPPSAENRCRDRRNAPRCGQSRTRSRRIPLRQRRFGLARPFLLPCRSEAGAGSVPAFAAEELFFGIFDCGRSGLYQVGDKVVYPHHGAGTVVKKEKREVLGEQREYLTIQILHNDMTVQVPSENCDKVGLRRVIVGDKEIAPVLKALTGVSTEMPKNWNRRFKHNRDKMKTGDILELAEVVRNLALRDREKGLSTGEKQMFVKAKKILASELMYAKDMDEDDVRRVARGRTRLRRAASEEESGAEEEGRRGRRGRA